MFDFPYVVSYLFSGWLGGVGPAFEVTLDAGRREARATATEPFPLDGDGDGACPLCAMRGGKARLFPEDPSFFLHLG